MTEPNTEVNAPEFQFWREGKEVTFCIEFTDEFAAIDFYQSMVAGADQGLIKFQLTTDPKSVKDMK